MNQPHGLSERQVVARRAQGQGNDVKLRTSRSYVDILRQNAFTFINTVLVSVLFLLKILRQKHQRQTLAV
jgi:cation-transporting ATPase E